MQILYDFQKNFETVELGKFRENGIISIRKDPDTTAIIEVIEDVKTMHITDRIIKEAGIHIDIKKIPGIIPGDRITVTGRVGEGEPLDSSWSIALIMVGGSHLTQHIKPRDVFAVSHILEEKELDMVLSVHTVGWGLKPPLMDFYVDNIIVSRYQSKIEEEDTRTMIFSIEDDTNVDRLHLSDQENAGYDFIVVRSGRSRVKAFIHEGRKALHISNRLNDWDGIDIILKNLSLHINSKYKITVRGHICSNAPLGSTIMLQGLPNYDWKSIIPIEKGMDFTLEHIMSRSDVEKWTSIRVATNTIGASTTFDIYSFEITRV